MSRIPRHPTVAATSWVRSVTGTSQGPAAAGEAPAAWQADLAQARRDADRILARIDFSRHDIVINVPGTGDRVILGGMQRAISKVWPSSGDASVVLLDYDTNWNFPRSIPQGMATLRLVLAGIAARGGGRHRVLLFGQSQGGIIIGEAMQEPAVRRMVARASLYGHPYMAVHHYDDGRDPKVWERSNPDDPISLPVHGRVREWVESIGKLFGGDVLGAVPTMVRGLITNPIPAIWTGVWLARGKLFPERLLKDPHGYDDVYEEGLRFLAGAPAGTFDALDAQQMIRAASSPFAGPYLRERA